ncbi:MAG: DNA-3-methyladenine glycosylase 2 family protein [Pseudomonadota bacterium]
MEFRLETPAAYDFFETTRLLRTGSGDPTLRRETDGLWRCAYIEGNPVTVRVRVAAEGAIHAVAFGPGASDVPRALPLWLGLRESDDELPPHPLIDRLRKKHAGLRLCNSVDVYEALLVTVLQQRVTWNEAAFAWRRLCAGLGEPAPGAAGLTLPPTPKALRGAGINRLMRFGMARAQAKTLLEVAFAASRLKRVAQLRTPAAQALLQCVPGVGPWTAASALGLRLGRPDPIITGDLHLPNTVCWALAGEARGTDARMVELLRPFAGQAFRVVRLLMAARIEAPRRGPRRPVVFGWR